MATDITSNEGLRLRRLVFYAEDVDRINGLLLGFVKKSGASAAMLIDREGHMVARQGYKQADSDAQSLAALVAGSFATTQQVARLLGDSDFRVMSQAGSTTAIHITLIGDRTLQVGVFPAEIKAGMIQVYCKELASQVDLLLKEATQRQTTQGAPQLEQGFSTAMKDQLDSLFKDL